MDRIEAFVADRLKLTLNDKFKNVLPVSNGIDFLGYIIRRDYTLVRRRVVNNLRIRLDEAEKELTGKSSRAVAQQAKATEQWGDHCHGELVEPLSNQGVSPAVFRYDYPRLEKLRAVLASYFGHMQWADTYGLKQALIKRYSFLEEYFYRANPSQPLYRFPVSFPSVGAQYQYYANRFCRAVVFFQVGCFYEFYKKGKGPRLLGLKEMKDNKRGALYGFPVKLGSEYAGKVLEKGIPVIIVKETELVRERLKERLPAMKIER